MPFEFKIDVDRRLLIATFTGEATLAEAQELVAQLYDDSRYSSSFNRVYDCRGVTRLPPLAELRGVAELLRRSADPAAPVRRALVVRGGALYRLASVLHALLDIFSVRLDVFSNLDEAVEWASRPGPALQSRRDPAA